MFDSEKLSQIRIVLLTQAGFEPPIFGIRIRRSTTRLPRLHPTGSILFYFAETPRESHFVKKISIGIGARGLSPVSSDLIVNLNVRLVSKMNAHTCTELLGGKKVDE